MPAVPADALRALAAVMEAYPELDAYLRQDLTAQQLVELVLTPRPRAAARAAGLCYRSACWVCFRSDRQSWAVRWYTPDPSKKYNRRYHWRRFGPGEDGRARAEAFQEALAPELAQLWEEFLNQRGNTP